jgi:hypothetical protein
MLGIGGENIQGFYAAMKYFQSLDNPNNKKFVEAFKAKYGPKSVIGDVTQAAYLGPWLWKMTVEKAGSFDIDKVAAASPDIELKRRPRATSRSTRTTTCGARRASARAGPTAVQGGRRVAQPDRARSVPEGLPVSTADAPPGRGMGAGGRGGPCFGAVACTEPPRGAAGPTVRQGTDRDDLQRNAQHRA